MAVDIILSGISKAKVREAAAVCYDSRRFAVERFRWMQLFGTIFAAVWILFFFWVIFSGFGFDDRRRPNRRK